jgi:hypothetical protein
MHMVTRMRYTRWERDRLGKLVLRQSRYRVVGRPYVLERGLALRDASMATLASALWFCVVLVIALNALGCASADGNYPTPPGKSSPEAQPVSLPEEVDAEPQQVVAPPMQRHWCCDAMRDGKPALTCGLSVRPENEATCYCSGIVSADAMICRDESPWTPGTFCTQGQLLCFEEE